MAIDTETIIALAGRLAGVEPGQVLAAAMRPDGALVVVVAPGPKYVFGPEQVAEAMSAARSGAPSGAQRHMAVPAEPAQAAAPAPPPKSGRRAKAKSK
jgi:hypothetical protein